jgi:Lon protease-like protein
MEGSVSLPAQVPVMPLPGALLFPHALLPLYIFEERYRKMLEYSLRDHRMFSVALIKPERGKWESPSDFFHIAGVGLIRACVGQADGTSNLILQGLEPGAFHRLRAGSAFPDRNNRTTRV